jgi:hypothetical protein
MQSKVGSFSQVCHVDWCVRRIAFLEPAKPLLDPLLVFFVTQLHHKTQDSHSLYKSADVNHVVGLRGQVPIEESDFIVIVNVDEEITFMHVAMHDAERLIVLRNVAWLDFFENTIPNFVVVDHLIVGFLLFLFEFLASSMECSDLLAELCHKRLI